MRETKPCPICGKMPSMARICLPSVRLSCACGIRTWLYLTPGKAIDAWNKLVDEIIAEGVGKNESSK